MKRRTPVATALLTLFAAPAVWAQQVPATPAPPAAAASATGELARVVVEGESAKEFAGTSSTKLGADLRDVPQSVTVLNKSLLESQGATSLADALRNVPGITLGGAEGGQIGNNINLNGFTARTDIYLDGFRDRGQYYRDTFALDAVEVMMGPSSMLFGRGSTGGAINQVSKRPTLKGSTELGASVTTNGMVRATLDHDQAIGSDAAVRVAVMGQSGRPTTRDEMKNRDFGIAPSITVGIGSPTQITLSALLQHNHDMPDYGFSPLNGRPVQVDRNAFYGFTDDHTTQDVGALNALVEHKISATSSLRNQTQYSNVRVNAVETASQGLGTVGAGGFTPLSPAGISALPLDQLWTRLQSHDRVIKDTSIFNQTDLTASATTGGVTHRLLFGAEVGHDSYSNQAYYRNGSCNGVALNPATGTSGYAACAPLLDPTYTASPDTAPSKAGNLSTSGATTLGAYVNDTLEFNDQFKFVGGLRYDRFSATVNNTITSATAPARIEQTVHFTSVRLGPLWQPTDSQSYYLSYSTSFNPSLEQLTNTTGGTAPLPPEKNTAYEVGGKWEPYKGLLALNASAFQITQDNARNQDVSGNYTATGTVRVRGARLGASGQLAHGWKVFAGYSYLDASIVHAIAVGTEGMVPGNTPKNTATLWSTYEVAPHWQLGGGAVAMSSRFLNNTDTVKVPGYVRLDATLGYHQHDYDIRLNLFNLANKYYYDALIQSDGGRAVPGTGRSAMISGTYRF
ncbi:TonB-dependent siderophore receptor [Paucibacter sp. R3-3]|uniref:TonB-dependent siderophore receptor n=1 Tax=Roseateles agri TaxID=3098619 RepID=A0ABU5DD73_9BURK|nr:TonB-dependent siderophore receptor [Paucibacter sp. R3-3]MDY0743700.1 TonB-dependent siderophore receptor [Paucibacter sp. R3-3]